MDRTETTVQRGQSASSGTFVVVRGDESMIRFIMATERLPGFEDLVGHWDEARHRSALSDGRHAYFVAWNGSEPIGFAILRDWGRSLLSKVIDATFEETNAWRLWLGVFPENSRGRRAYEGVGFKAEGIARGSAFFGGVYRDELIMALLRPEWQAEQRFA